MSSETNESIVEAVAGGDLSEIKRLVSDDTTLESFVSRSIPNGVALAVIEMAETAGDKEFLDRFVFKCELYGTDQVKAEIDVWESAKYKKAFLRELITRSVLSGSLEEAVEEALADGTLFHHYFKRNPAKVSEWLADPELLSKLGSAADRFGTIGLAFSAKRSTSAATEPSGGPSSGPADEPDSARVNTTPQGSGCVLLGFLFLGLGAMSGIALLL